MSFHEIIQHQPDFEHDPACPELENEESRIVVVCGPSGVGKGTIVGELMEASDQNDYVLSVSNTTRDQRPGEADGAYDFVSFAEFETRIHDGYFDEWANFNGNLYGTPKPTELFDKADRVILEIEIEGAFQMHEKYPDAKFIFVLPPSMQELRDRLVGRGDTPEDQIEGRFARGFEEIEAAYNSGIFEFIVNGDSRQIAEAQLGAFAHGITLHSNGLTDIPVDEHVQNLLES